MLYECTENPLKRDDQSARRKLTQLLNTTVSIGLMRYKPIHTCRGRINYVSKKITLAFSFLRLVFCGPAVLWLNDMSIHPRPTAKLSEHTNWNMPARIETCCYNCYSPVHGHGQPECTASQTDRRAGQDYADYRSFCSSTMG